MSQNILLTTHPIMPISFHPYPAQPSLTRHAEASTTVPKAFQIEE